MQTYVISADKQLMQALLSRFPPCSVDERFSKNCINIHVPDDVVDDVCQWCDDQNVDAELV